MVAHQGTHYIYLFILYDFVCRRRSPSSSSSSSPSSYKPKKKTKEKKKKKKHKKEKKKKKEKSKERKKLAKRQSLPGEETSILGGVTPHPGGSQNSSQPPVNTSQKSTGSKCFLVVKLNWNSENEMQLFPCLSVSVSDSPSLCTSVCPPSHCPPNPICLWFLTIKNKTVKI